MPATGSSAMTERQPAFRARPLTRGSDQLHRAAQRIAIRTTRRAVSNAERIVSVTACEAGISKAVTAHEGGRDLI